MKAALEAARANQTVVRIGVNGQEFEGKVVEIHPNNTMTFQPWRSPAEARRMTSMSAIAWDFGRQPIRWPWSKKPKKEPPVFEVVAFDTPPLIIAVEAITYVKEFV